MANINSSNVSVFTINPTSGALSAAGTVLALSSPASIAMASGTTPLSLVPKFAYAANFSSNNISVYTINPTTGALTAGTAVAAGTNPSSVTVDPTGKFAYAANINSSNVSVYTINPTSGALTAVGLPVAAGTNPESVTVDPTGKFAYAANVTSNNISVYTINPTTGALTAVGSPVGAGTNPFSVTTSGGMQ